MLDRLCVKNPISNRHVVSSVCHKSRFPLPRSPNLGLTIQYSTLSEYFTAVRSEAISTNLKFPVLPPGNDFFPYADNADSYWTGYYVTRPLLKVRLPL